MKVTHIFSLVDFFLCLNLIKLPILRAWMVPLKGARWLNHSHTNKGSYTKISIDSIFAVYNIES